MKSTERLNKRYVFVNNNMKLLLSLHKQRKINGWGAFVKNPIVDEIANKARLYINYSTKTVNCDIVWSLYKVAYDLHKENIKYQLKYGKG